MIKKIIYDYLIVPQIESELELDEIGLLTSMINDVEADYKNAQDLSETLNVSAEEVKTTADKLIQKGYLIIIDGVYAVNKFKLKDMILIKPNKNKSS